MSNARNLARLLPNASGQLPDANLAAIAAGKVSGQLADANMASGSVLQVVQTVLTTPFTGSPGGSGNFVGVTGLSVSITPASATSKILVMAYFGLSASSTGYRYSYALYRNSSQVCIGDASSTRTRASWSGDQNMANGNSMNCSINYLDSPATTSAVTYQIGCSVESGGQFTINRQQSGADGATFYSGASTIIAMEIAP